MWDSNFLYSSSYLSAPISFCRFTTFSPIFHHVPMHLGQIFLERKNNTRKKRCVKWSTQGSLKIAAKTRKKKYSEYEYHYVLSFHWLFSFLVLLSNQVNSTMNKWIRSNWKMERLMHYMYLPNIALVIGGFSPPFTMNFYSV